MLLRLSRRLGLALGVAVIAALAVPAAASADVTERFSANSGDRCGYGFTFGHLFWSSTVPVVGVNGSVVDNPVDRTFQCEDDGRISVAQFVAFNSNGSAVDRQAERANNGQTDFSFRLGANTSTTRIAYVTVQVCRFSSNPTPDYCGDIKFYRNPS